MQARQVFLILSAVEAFLFAVRLPVAALYRIQIVGLDAFQLVLVGAVLELSVFLFETPTGAVADLRGRRASVVTGFGLIGAGFLIEVAVPTLAGVLASQVVWGIGATFCSGATQAWIADEVGSERVGRLFLRGARWASWAAVAGLAAAAAAGLADVRVPLAASGVLALGLADFLGLAMPETGFRPSSDAARGALRALGAQLAAGVGLARRNAGVRGLLLAAVLLGASSEPVDRLWELHLLSYSLPWMAPVVWFAALRAAALVLGAAATRGVERWSALSDPTDARRALLALNAGIAVAIVALAAAPAAVVAMGAFVMFGALRVAAEPVARAWMNHLLPSSLRATVLSVQGQADSLGQVLAGPAIGRLAAATTLRVGLAASALLLVPVQVVYQRIRPAGTRAERGT